MRSSDVSLRSEPNNAANYSVAVVATGDLLVTTGGNDQGWTRVRVVPSGLDGVRALVKLDEGAMDRQGDVLVVTGGTHDLRMPNANARTEDGYDPFRCWSSFGEATTGDRLFITGEFVEPRGDGATWFEVLPPESAELWVHRAHLDDVDEADVPESVAIQVVPVTAEPETPTEETPIDPAVEPVVDIEDVEEPTDEPGNVEPEIVIEDPETSEPETAEPMRLAPELLADVTLQDAESTWETIRRQPQNESELETMQLIYTAISERPETTEDDRQRAEARIKQIAIQRDLQRGIDSLRRIEQRNAVDKERIESIREALLDRSDYTVIGRLQRSRIYDGRRLPLLYRLEDPSSGRTIAYIQPAEGMPLGQGVGRIVGIVGGERQDLSRRIKIVTPYRFEIDLTEEIDQDD